MTWKGVKERDSVCGAFTVNILDTVSTIYYTWMIAYRMI